MDHSRSFAFIRGPLMLPAGFIFVTCQIGAEPAVKNELARRWPAFRFAYSRPGFLTFKLPPGPSLPEDFDLHSVFARTHGFSIGKAIGEADEDRAAAAWQLAGDLKVDCLHVWQRDLFEPGHRGYEPAPTELAAQIRKLLVDRAPPELAATIQSSAEGLAEDRSQPRRFQPAGSARPGQVVLDCIIVEPHEWWIGYHRAASIPSRWPGGLFTMPLPDGAVSRAYLKIEEALAWSKMPLRAGDIWVEIGSAPGGASQALLSHGLRVIGIDPADMDPAVLANPNFTHWKKRGADVKRREYALAQYLTADVNVAPNYTLDTVESIVTHREVNLRGLILMLKLLEWKLSDELPQYLDRIRSWGYGHVRARQLHHNRQEVCVTATRER